MAARIPHSRPTCGDEEARAAREALISGRHARGSRCREFERLLAAAVRRDNAHACSSGTAALTLVLLALRAGAGHADEVLVPSLTCAAVANAVYAAAARPVFYDSGYDPPAAAAFRGLVTPRTRAIVLVASPTHLPELDWPTDDDGWFHCDGVPLLLDRCQQLSPHGYGAGRPRVEIFSFYATKCISTGVGGAAATSDRALHDRIVDLNTHDEREDYAAPRWNFQFDDVRASIGIEQLGRLEGFCRRRSEHAVAYDHALGGAIAGRQGIAFRYLLELGDRTGVDSLRERLAAHGVETKRPVFRPLHRYAGLADANFPMAVAAWDRHLSLPIYPSLSDAERDEVIKVVLESGALTR